MTNRQHDEAIANNGNIGRDKGVNNLMNEKYVRDKEMLIDLCVCVRVCVCEREREREREIT